MADNFSSYLMLKRTLKYGNHFMFLSDKNVAFYAITAQLRAKENKTAMHLSLSGHYSKCMKNV
jgi:hypothetical protein